MLEAERHKAAFGRVDDWAVKFLQLVEDDVTATIIQVHNSFLSFYIRYLGFINSYFLRLCLDQGFGGGKEKKMEKLVYLTVLNGWIL